MDTSNNWNTTHLGQVGVEDPDFSWEATGSELWDSVQSDQDQDCGRSGKVLFMTQGTRIYFQEEGRGGLEETVMRREISWLKDMIIELKGAKQLRGSAFPNCFPIPNWNIYTHWYRWWPWSKMDVAHLSERSIFFHNMRWSGPRIF